MENNKKLSTDNNDVCYLHIALIVQNINSDAFHHSIFVETNSVF